MPIQSRISPRVWPIAKKQEGVKAAPATARPTGRACPLSFRRERNGAGAVMV